ncbi:MAG: PQQ-binding-like beta-propeller repeat protein, partial [Planctomycetes bacterium]|nr:PQQ-binding-like beta-propeller repeat protein [Planctomycetota bacterium]
LVDGYVLVTPADNYTPRTRSGEIHCLNLIDGKRIWKRKRNKALYLACVTGGKVILVGRNAVTALSIKDGTPHKDWPAAKKVKPAYAPVTRNARPLSAFAKLPDGALASGRGFLSDGHYYLPLTSGEIVKIDLSNGKIVKRIHLRDGFVPGNLICYRDQIISQGALSLAAFHQLGPSRRWVEKTLKDHPRDAAALLRRGRIRLEEDRFDDAVADLAASLAETPDGEEARQLLVEAMLAKLADDFEQGRPPAQKFVDRLRSLVETPEERITLLRRFAEGLAKTGKRIEAFKTLLQLVDLDVPADETSLEQIEPSLLARRVRWIQASLGQLRREASADERSAMEAVVDLRLPNADMVADLERFAEHFVDFDATDTVRRTLVEQLAGPTTLARRERLLRRLERSADPVQRRAAIADMAALLVEARRADEAAAYYVRLGSDPELAGEVCRNGKTGRELAKALAKDSPVRRYLGSSAVWPRGAVTHDAKPLTGIRQPSLTRSYRVSMRGAGGPFFTETSAFLNPSDRSLWARDAYGAERWRLSLSADSLRSRFGSSMIALDSYCVARGHLLLFSSSNSIYAIDTLRASAQRGVRSAASETQSPAVLWRHERNEQIPGVAVGQGYQDGLSFGRYYGSRRLNRNVAAIGPLNEHGVCYQRVRELICVDPLTGQTQWVRCGLPRNCELFGDDNLLFVVPPNSTRAQVLRADDGKLLGERNVPPKSKWITTVGRYLLTKKVADDGHLVFDMIDPWKQQDPQRWPPLTFAAGSQFTLVDHDALAVLEPDGRFTIHGLKDRRVLVEAHLQEEAVDEVLQAIHVMPSRDRYLLVVDRPVRSAAGNVRVTAAPSGSDVNMKMVNARVYAFDRAGGKPLWPAPARIDRYGLLLHQPRELPVFVVARQVTFSGKSTASELLCLDKRTGRLVYRSAPLPKPITNYTIAGDPSQRAVSLMIRSGGQPTYVRLVFSDQPTPPDPPYQGIQFDRSTKKPAKTFKGASGDPFSPEPRDTSDAESEDPFSPETPDDDD